MRRILRYMRGGYLLVALCTVLTVAHAEEQKESVPASDNAAGWKLTQPAEIDKSQSMDNSGGALRIGSKGEAVWNISDKDVCGRVDIWVKEENRRPENPAARQAGPCMGLVNSDGNVLGLVALYAPYLGKGDNYVAASSGNNSWHAKMQYIGQRRDDKWNKWSFVADEKGYVSFLCNDKPITRFTDDMRCFGGFTGVKIIGDSSQLGGKSNYVWVAKAVAKTGAAISKPEVKAIRYVPDEDPVEANPPKFSEALVKAHPRIAFSAEGIEKLKKKIQTPTGKKAWEHLSGYISASRAPMSNVWMSNDTDAQREGFWRSPTLALHYAISGDEKDIPAAKKRLQQLLDAPLWQAKGEVDCGMGAANILVGAALLYDTFYDKLDPDFRNKFRDKLFEKSRDMYYAGHLARRPGIHYWQGDPGNNHRWHRLAGLVCGVLASYEPDDPKCNWLLARTLDELKFIHEWLPPDGSFHDSASYMVFGSAYLILAFEAADRCLGTEFIKTPWIKNNASFRLNSLTPGFKEGINFGDGGGFGFFNNYLYAGTGLWKQFPEQDGLTKFEEAVGGKAFGYGWATVLWRNTDMDQEKGKGTVGDMPRVAYFPDLGTTYFRDSWTDPKGVVLAFKCGPMGGYTLNRFRNSDPDKLRYINVAHDHPDTNSFQLFVEGEGIASDDGYPQTRKALFHNVVLVNGKGHTHEWKGFSQPWSEKGKQIDMTNGGVMKAVSSMETMAKGDVAAAEGEAAEPYTGLDRYRRAAVWVNGGYVLILDDLRAPKESEFTWLLHSPKIAKKSAGSYLIGKSAPRMVALAANPAVVSDEIMAENDENHSKDHLVPRGDRLEAMTKGEQSRYVVLIDAWGKGNIKLEDIKLGDKEATFKVNNGGRVDSWTWKYAPDVDTPSTLIRKDSDGKVEEVLSPALKVDPRKDLL